MQSASQMTLQEMKQWYKLIKNWFYKALVGNIMNDY